MLILSPHIEMRTTIQLIVIATTAMYELAWLYLIRGYWSQTLRRSANSSSNSVTRLAYLGCTFPQILGQI